MDTSISASVYFHISHREILSPVHEFHSITVDTYLFITDSHVINIFFDVGFRTGTVVYG